MQRADPLLARLRRDRHFPKERQPSNFDERRPNEKFRKHFSESFLPLLERR